MDEVSESHELFGIDIDASICPSKLLGSHVYLYNNVWSYFNQIFELSVKAILIELNDVIFLKLVGFLTNYIPIGDSIIYGDDLHTILFDCKIIMWNLMRPTIWFNVPFLGQLDIDRFEIFPGLLYSF
jgi:hypothetical protein